MMDQETFDEALKRMNRMYEHLNRTTEHLNRKAQLDPSNVIGSPNPLEFNVSYTTEEPEEGCGCDCDDEDYTISELLEMLWDKMTDEGFVSLSKNLDGDIIHVEIEEESI